MNTLINWLLDALFPESCLGCGKRPIIICDLCTANLRSAERETRDNIIAVYDYRDPVIKKAIWNLKYYKKRYLGSLLGKLLHEATLEDVSDIKIFSGQAIFVVPTPLSPLRAKSRGYNQAKIIAENFCRCERKEVFELRNDILIKKADTLPQARIENRDKRLRNIRGAFEVVKPDIVKGRTIIVIDDVTTTGATLTEMMKVLKRAGAKKVVGYAIAH